jgi:hypothetical protein
MRTTLEIDDDVMLMAKEIARLRNERLGHVISELARRGLAPETSPVVEIQNGIPVWIHGPGAISVTSEMVRNFAEDE